MVTGVSVNVLIANISLNVFVKPITNQIMYTHVSFKEHMVATLRVVAILTIVVIISLALVS